MLRDENERRAASEVIGPKPVQDALCQARLAGAKLARQQHHVASRRVLTHDTPDGTGLFGAY